MAHRSFGALLALGLLLWSPSAPAQDGRFAASVSGGNLGLGLEVFYGLHPQWNGRLGFTVQSVQTSSLGSDVVNYTANALVDWVPPKAKGFRLTSGLGLLQTDRSMYPEREGGRYAGYLGLGWGNPVSGNGAWRFLVDTGVYWRFGPIYSETTVPGAAARDASGDASTVYRTEAPSRLDLRISLGAAYRF